MKQMTSTKFRLLHTELGEVVEVTMNGKVIGTWTPANAGYPITAAITTSAETLVDSAPPRVAAPEGEPTFVRPFSKSTQAGRK